MLLAICAGNSVTRNFDVSLICAWINGWVNNGEAGELRRHHAHYDVTVMTPFYSVKHPTVSILSCLFPEFLPLRHIAPFNVPHIRVYQIERLGVFIHPHINNTSVILEINHKESILNKQRNKLWILKMAVPEMLLPVRLTDCRISFQYKYRFFFHVWGIPLWR